MYPTPQPKQKSQKKPKQQMLLIGGGIIATLVLLVLVLVLFGRGGDENEGLHVYTSQEVMEDFATMYKEYTTDKKASPKQLSDFSMPYEPAHMLGYARVRDGDVIVLWGGSLTTGDNRVVAYEKQVPENGGFVAFQDGTVKKMTAEEFKTAPKIK